MKETLALYQSAHKWLVIPLVVILVAFLPLYFATFTSEPWAYHTHALSAIAWYVFMATQPYLATHGRLKSHRKWGMVGLHGVLRVHAGVAQIEYVPGVRI